jgi:acetyl-CoA synthetase
VATTFQLVFDYQQGDVFCCAADIGWITGHSYILYGPLLSGGTTVMFESTPTYPDAGRYWQMVDDLGINIFYTAPTALRAIAQVGDEPVKKYSRKSLRLLGSVGEPINPEVWRWYHDVVGDGRCDVVDTYWQTETGGMMISAMAGVTPGKPGSATLPLPGIRPVLLEPESGKLLEGNGVSGALCMAQPWPGQARTVWGDHQRFQDTYFTQYKGYYFTGDGCTRDEDGYYWITGRIDDVLNVSGHRLGTAEVESALVAHEAVAEAAVVGYPHPIKGQGIYAYVLLAKGAERSAQELEGELKQQVRQSIGGFAMPDVIHVAPGLPKTRSGKIMRRILRKLAAGEFEGLGDTTTLAEPEVVDKLIAQLRERAG